jgi:hypothetical protein
MRYIFSKWKEPEYRDRRVDVIQSELRLHNISLFYEIDTFIILSLFIFSS